MIYFQVASYLCNLESSTASIQWSILFKRVSLDNESDTEFYIKVWNNGTGEFMELFHKDSGDPLLSILQGELMGILKDPGNTSASNVKSTGPLFLHYCILIQLRLIPLLSYNSHSISKLYFKHLHYRWYLHGINAFFFKGEFSCGWSI